MTKLTGRSGEIICDRGRDTKHWSPLLSIIVPVYNTALYVTETLNSISEEYASLLEVIVVDDGSTDNSLDTVTAWTSKTSIPVAVIKQSNMGLSAARNSGMIAAKGHYIGFCDSDDWIKASAYIRMAQRAKELDSDVAICRSLVFDGETGEAHDFYDAWLWNVLLHGRPSRVVSAEGEPRIMQLEPNVNPRIIRRDIVRNRNIQFPKGLHFEDLPVHVKYLRAAKRVLLWGETGYFYRINRPGKITDQKSERRFDIVESAALAFQELGAMGTEGSANLFILATRMMYWCGANTLNKDRNKFFEKSCALCSEMADIKMWRMSMSYARGERERIMLSAFAAGAAGVLVAQSSQRRIPMLQLLRLFTKPISGSVSRRIAVRVILRQGSRIMRAAKRWATGLLLGGGHVS